jgi:predicted ATPase
MRLHALCGDRAEALRVFRDCRAALRRELDMEPSDATLRLHDRIRSSDPFDVRGDSRRNDAGGSLPLVGRVDEWRALRAVWDRAAAGTPLLALIEGEAGIGKSRLAAELAAWAGRQGFSTATTRCYAAEGRLALAPVTGWLRSEPLRPHLSRLDEVWLTEISRVVPELANERPGLARPEAITGVGQRQRLFEALVHAVRLARPPLLLVIDDLQWCDLETLQWLHFLLRFDAAAPLLVVGTVRSEEATRSNPVHEFRLRMSEAAALTEIALAPLDAAETARLAAQTANRQFDAETTTRLYRETEGNPLFVVETIRSDGGRTPAARTDGAPLPPRVHAVIAGRLAQLSQPARQVASAAAVIARAFTLPVLARTLNCSEPELVPALDELWQRRIVREQEPNAYDFTHDKLREVAYEETGAPQLRSLHQLVARALEAVDAADLDRVSSQIAAHFDRAGLAAQAVPYYIRAASAAQSVYANGEAEAQIERGLALLATLPEGSRRDAWELELLLVSAPIYRVTRGWTAPELESVLQRALALSEKVGTSAQRAQVLYGLQSLYLVQGKPDRAQLLTDEIVASLGRTAGAEPQLAAASMMVGALLVRGRFREAIDEWEKLAGNLDPRQLQHLQDSQGLNYRVITLAWQSHALWCVGRPQTALERCQEAVQLARELAQPFNQALATTYLALLQQLRADPGIPRRQAEEALRLCNEFEAPYYGAWASILVAYAKACESPRAESIAELREAILRFTGSGARLRLPYFLALLGDACLRAHDAERGLHVLDEAMAAAREGSEQWWDAELHRLRGEMLVARGSDAGEADASYRRACEIAQAQDAKSLELRAATSRLRLWRNSPRAPELKRLLAQTLDSFSEGLDTPDLVAARVLLLEPR